MSRSHLLLALTRILLILPLLLSIPVKTGLPSGSIKAVDDSGQGFTTHKDKAFTTGNVLANDIGPGGEHLFIKSFDASSAVGLVSLNPWPDGSLDTGFGTGGIVTTNMGDISYSSKAIALQSDGKIVIAGGNGYPRRFIKDGSLDTGFGSTGIVTDSVADVVFANTVAIQPDGKIVTAGKAENADGSYKFAVVRYNTDGALDPSFNGDGIVTTDFGTVNAQGNAVAIQPDGKIIVLGYVVIERYRIDLAIARYNQDGSLDTSFGKDGKVTTRLGGEVFGWAVVLQPDGKIIVTGYSYSFLNDPKHNFFLVRYNPDGSLDASFDGDGIVITNFPIGGKSYDVALQPDGKIVVAGYIETENYLNFALVRYNPDGSLDPLFGDGGITTTNFDTFNSMGKAVAIQSDGKIIVAGWAGNHPISNFALARYNPDGSLDTNFGNHGKVITYLGNDAMGQGIVLQPDGKIVVAGNSGYLIFVLARYDAGVSFVYDPNGKFDWLAPDQRAFDTFTYVASDGVLTDTATVTITIQGGFQSWLPMISNY